MLLRHAIKCFFIEAIETTRAKQCNIIIGSNKLNMAVLMIMNEKDPS
jgi:hypothetical protein